MLHRRCILGGAMIAGLGAAAVQAYRVHQDPAGAAVHVVALLVTLLVVVIQAGLILRLILGARHTEHRTTLKEAPLVAAIGAFLALFLVLTTPLLVFRDGRSTDAGLLSRVFNLGDIPETRIPDAPVWPEKPVPPAPAPVPVPESAPAPIARTLEPLPVPRTEPTAPLPPLVELEPIEAMPVPAPAPAVASTQDPAEADASERKIARRSFEEFWIPFRSTQDPHPLEVFIRLGLPSIQNPRDLPPVESAASLLLLGVRADGRMSETAGIGFKLDLDNLHDDLRLEPALELDFEIPLAPRDVLKISAIGLRFRDTGILAKDLPLGASTGSQGDEYELTSTWGHLFAGFSHRFIGYTVESRFDFAAHVGVVLDYTLTRITVSGLEASTPEGEQGWAAPALGVSLAFWSSSSGGLVFDLVQTIPMNIGGQMILQTDLRLCIQYDVSERASIFFGYHKVMSVYRTFEDPVRPERARTRGEVEAGGPLFGIDIRL